MYIYVPAQTLSSYRGQFIYVLESVLMDSDLKFQLGKLKATCLAAGCPMPAFLHCQSCDWDLIPTIK